MYPITTLILRDDQLLVGGTLTSLLLKLKGSQIEPIAKGYGSLWPTCVELLLDAITVVWMKCENVVSTCQAHVDLQGDYSLFHSDCNLISSLGRKLKSGVASTCGGRSETG